MTEIIDRSSFRLPMRSMRNCRDSVDATVSVCLDRPGAERCDGKRHTQGMKEARKNQVCKTPDIREASRGLRPTEARKMVVV